MLFYLALMFCVICIEQTSLTWPHFFSYSYYLVLYSFVFYLIILLLNPLKSICVGTRSEQGFVA